MWHVCAVYSSPFGPSGRTARMVGSAPSALLGGVAEALVGRGGTDATPQPCHLTR